MQKLKDFIENANTVFNQGNALYLIFLHSGLQNALSVAKSQCRIPNETLSMEIHIFTTLIESSNETNMDSNEKFHFISKSC